MIDKYKDRSLVIRVVLALIVLIFIGRLFQWQIIKNYNDVAEDNALYKKVNYAPRGLIYDRNGKLLVYNQPTYDIMVTMNDLRLMKRNHTPLDTAELCKLLNIRREYFDARMSEIKNKRKNRGYSPLTPQVFLAQLSPKEYAFFHEQLRKFPGFSIQKRSMRKYAYPVAAQVLGRMGEVSQDDIDHDSYYSSGDYIGVSGVEKTYEKDLRGVNGETILLRDARGRIKGSYKHGEYDTNPIAGKNLTLSLDVDLQLLAEQLLTGKKGSVVAIEPSTGEVLVMASSPTWNPEIMVGRKQSENYLSLLRDKNKPLLNRAIMGVYSPGSTFKTIEALVCQQMGGITAKTLFPCNGPNSTPIRCTHFHGSPVSLTDAIAQSCNPYFWQTFRNTLEKYGYGKNNETFKKQYSDWRKKVMSFGLGSKFTDSDIYGLLGGEIPSANYYNKIYGKRGWRALTIRSNSIGQGEIQVTPLQLANVVAIIANKGYYITPHLNKNDSLLVHRHFTAVDSMYYPIVQEGMYQVVTSGTARIAHVDSIQICGKTGTTDNSHGRPHSLFIAYAPKDNPKIAVAVVIENAGFGATYAAPIASMLIERYLKGHMNRDALYERIKNVTLISDDR